jgi:hypothetical protein
MALLTDGYWPDTYWAESYWMDDYWPNAGSGAIHSIAGTIAMSFGVDGTMSVGNRLLAVDEPVVNEFRFPSIPIDTPQEQVAFMEELRLALETAFFGNYYVGGELHVDGKLYTNNVLVTPLGGVAVKLKNNTGAVTVVGDVVKSSSSVENAVELTDADAADAIGVFYESDVGVGEDAWVVVTGIAYVRMDAGGCSAHDRIVCSTTPGRGDVGNSPSTEVHFREIGHALEAAAANANAKCALHFL